MKQKPPEEGAAEFLNETIAGITAGPTLFAEAGMLQEFRLSRSAERLVLKTVVL